MGGCAVSPRALAFGCLLAVACESHDPGSGLARMINQEKLKSYEATDLFPDRRAMRTPPDHTVARGDDDEGSFADDAGAEAEVARIPITLSKEEIQHGRERFEIFCAPCHGVLGNGDSVVARKMELRRPPSLVDETARRFTPGQVHAAILHGYGLMRSYASDLSPKERWEVVAYVRALQIATGSSLEDLPADVRDEAKAKVEK